MTLTLSAIAVAIEIATHDTPVPSSWGFRGASEVFGVSSATIGLIVASRRPDNLNGWLFCAIGLLFSLEAALNEYVIAGVLAVPGGLPFAAALSWTLTWLWLPPFAIAVIFLPLHFPTGHLLTPRWLWVRRFSIVAVVVFGTALAFDPGPIVQARFVDNPLGWTALEPQVFGVLVVGPVAALFGIAIGLAVASLIVRFRRATGDARLQIKWFALAVLIAGTTFGVYMTVSLLTQSTTTVKALELLVIAALLGVPIAAGLAILRYRLYDIDRIVSRTISYGILTAFLVAVFLAVNLALQAALSSVTSSNSLAIAASTLLAAALFTPVRQRVQRRVDRRFDRARFDAERTADAFAERLRDQVDIATVISELEATVGGSMRPSALGLWLRGDR